ncbi:bifunctional (p)ppGpp synthetase/guanosine-3',5'-bis(diphosphate) 3'-pyrophosphohydrolase [bacterium]|nr:bifunctional (p)ppGpp synthetase/guanosine-3',5'-bis(diphosphate) 3'-pyrophosphohydrolase [bacterium]
MLDVSSYIEETKKALLSHSPESDWNIIDKSIEFSKKVHKEHLRLSGDSFFAHSAEIALIVAKELRLDTATVGAAYLHDVMEYDSTIEREFLEKEFGLEIAKIVDGFTILSKTSYQSKDESRAAGFRKMIQISTLDDIRILFLKLADRLHNMRTLKYLPKDKQLQKALETKELYAPIAHKLGLYKIKSELEDLAFKFLDFENYRKIADFLDEKKEQRDSFISETITELKNILESLSIKGRVDGRAKHIYSIYEKMVRANKQFNELYDITAFRVITTKKEECYLVLGEIHSFYKAIPGRFKDYISMPKSNNYQSLHTAVFSKTGKIIEIQIRTEEMHLIAENGFAAHWAYKAKKSAESKEQNEINVLKKIVKHWLQEEIEKEDENQEKNISNKSRNIESDVSDEIVNREIYVFTPGGDVVILPEGATVLDFAYSIHTNLGNQCSGATINGSIAPLRQKLKSGQVISITKSSNQKPKAEWLDFVITSRARAKISSIVNQEEKEQAKQLGLSVLEKECTKLGFNFNKLVKDNTLEERAKTTRYANLAGIATAVGYGKLDVKDILEKLIPETKDAILKRREQEEETRFARFLKKFSKKASDSKSGVIIDGLENIMIKFAKCCNPIPNEPIIGYISVGFGVTIHKKNCVNVENFDSERIVQAYWQNEGAFRPIIIEIRGSNKVGLLSEITKVISKMELNIESITSSKEVESNTVEMLLTILVSDIDMLKKIKIKLSKIDGILYVDFRRTV